MSGPSEKTCFEMREGCGGDRDVLCYNLGWPQPRPCSAGACWPPVPSIATQSCPASPQGGGGFEVEMFVEGG